MPKISVIIPIYNVEKYIKKALDSCIKQSFSDIEIICIDDCSTDGSLEIVNEYALMDRRFVILKQDKNQGQGVARNRGLEVASGDYIMFLDPDDWFEKEAFERAYNQISSRNDDVVFFNTYNFNEFKNERSINLRKKDFLEKQADFSISPNEVKMEKFPPCWSVTQIYKREFLNNNEIRFAENRYCEDVPFVIKAFLCADSISVLNEPLYNYREIKKKTKSSYFDKWGYVFRNSDLALDMVKNSKYKDYLLYPYLRYYVGSIYYNFKTLFSSDKIQKEKYYKETRLRFLSFNENKNLFINKNDELGKFFSNVLRCKNLKCYELYRIISEKLFSVYNGDGYKLFYFLGIRLKIKTRGRSSR